MKSIYKTVHNACNSKDVDALKFQLVHHDAFYNGQIQQDSPECLLMLIDIINKGSMPNSSSTTYPTGASVSDILFSFSLESTYIVYMYAEWGSPPKTPKIVLHTCGYDRYAWSP